MLSEQETYDYLLHQYLTANHGNTRDPSLFKPLQKDDFARYLQPSEMDAVILSVLIDERGQAAEVAVSSGVSDSQDDICELVKQVRFFPSLKDGEPVKRRVKLRLSQMAL